MMSKTERNELCKIIRQQVRVLRAEIAQRRAEMLVEIEHEIAERYRDEDLAWAEAQRIGNAIAAEADRKVNETFRRLIGDTFVEERIVSAWLPRQPKEHRTALKREAERRVDAAVKAALVRLARQEADLLRGLSVDLIESEEARRFLASLPVAAELVAAPSLHELEAVVAADEEA